MNSANILGANYTKIEDLSGAASGKISVGLTRFNTTELSGFGIVVDITLPVKITGQAAFLN